MAVPFMICKLFRVCLILKVFEFKSKHFLKVDTKRWDCHTCRKYEE